MADRQLKDKAVDIKGKKYVLVSDRIQYLADNYEGRYDIESNYEYYPSEKMRVVRAKLTIRDEKKEGSVVYTGLAQEIEGQGMVNKTSALENAETSAVGRACAMAGIGVIDSVASVDEMTKATNRQKYYNNKAKDIEIVNDSPFAEEKKEKRIFDQQAFENLKLKKDIFSFEEAKKMIDENYSISPEMEGKVMELYGVNPAEVLFG